MSNVYVYKPETPGWKQVLMGSNVGDGRGGKVGDDGENVGDAEK